MKTDVEAPHDDEDLDPKEQARSSGKLQICFFCLKKPEKRELAEISTTSTDRKAGSIFVKHWCLNLT
jgi:hypothetical protein